MVLCNMLNNERLSVSNEPPYDALQAFVRENHIALKGADSGSLKGLVFAIKDVFKVLGSTYSNGHPEWLRTHEPDDFTASSVTRLLNEGADLVGKTVCDELCFSISGENWNYGSPINPHDPRRLTGGSSAGSGAATAAGLVDFATGSDCLGSVRVPASYNGVFGIRPTYRRITNDGEAPYCASMDVLGYVSANPDTFRRVSRVLLGPDKEKVKFKKLVVPKDCIDLLTQDVVEAIQPAIEHISNSLESVEYITLSSEGMDKWVEIFRTIQGYEVWESYGGWVNKYRPRLSRGVKERLQWSSTITLQEYRSALDKRQGIIEQIEKHVTPDTILCVPTTASVAPLKTTPLEEISATRMLSTYLLCISPLAGIPQINVPLIKQYDVPLGLSLIGAKDTDLALVDFSTAIAESYPK